MFWFAIHFKERNSEQRYQQQIRNNDRIELIEDVINGNGSYNRANLVCDVLIGKDLLRYTATAAWTP